MSDKSGVGGQLSTFCIYEKGNQSNQVVFEAAPARRSFYDKQGQTVPGVGAGMDFMLNTNLAKLNVPGGMPIYQPMGIAEERIEFVGSFIGFDEYMEDSKGDPVFDNAQAKNQKGMNAWDKAQLLFESARKQRKMVLKMEWPNVSVKYAANVQFEGYLKSVVRTFATAQRVYYRVLFVVDAPVTRTVETNPVNGQAGSVKTPVKEKGANGTGTGKQGSAGEGTPKKLVKKEEKTPSTPLQPPFQRRSFSSFFLETPPN